MQLKYHPGVDDAGRNLSTVAEMLKDAATDESNSIGVALTQVMVELFRDRKEEDAKYTNAELIALVLALQPFDWVRQLPLRESCVGVYDLYLCSIASKNEAAAQAQEGGGCRRP